MISMRSLLLSFLSRVSLMALVSGFFAIPAYSAKPTFTWTPATPEELAETSPKVEPGAAAEALLNRVELDDNPTNLTRTYHTTQRFKIYDPERASAILSLNYWDAEAKTFGLMVEARLTLPSGQIKEFTEKSFLERSVENKTEGRGILALLGKRQEKSTQRYLPISGVERGSVLEVQMRWEKTGKDFLPFDVFLLQLVDVPVRLAEFSFMSPEKAATQIATLKSQPLEATTVKKRRLVKASAVSMPAMRTEPHSGPYTDNCEFGVVVAPIIPRYRFFDLSGDEEEFKKKTLAGHSINRFGAWSTIGTFLGDFTAEHGKPNGRVKALAAEICRGAESELEKARRIHDHVLRHYQKYLRFTQQKKLRNSRDQFSSLNDVLGFEKLNRQLTSDDFHLLSYSLSKAAGLDAYLVALSDRSFMRFDRRFVAFEVIPYSAVGTLIDGRWYFSAPGSQIPLPFDMLPPNNLAQSALVGLTGEELVPVPLPPPETTVLTQSGEFRLAADGSIEGEGHFQTTGYMAAILRYVLRDLDPASQKKLVRESLQPDVPSSASLQIREIQGLNGVEEPLIIPFTITGSGYATRVQDRLIVKPSFFRINAQPLFTASTRYAPMSFDFRWQEIDRVTLKLPPEYALETPIAPRSYPNDFFNYTVSLKHSPKNHIIALERNYTCNAAEVKASGYAAVKGLHGLIQNSDQHEIVLKLISTDTSPTQPASTP